GMVNANSSPIFSFDPKFYSQRNTSVIYSPGPLDTMDYDSLAFSIEPVQTNYNTNVGYQNGYSYEIPLTPYCPPNPGYLLCRPLFGAKPVIGFGFDNYTCQLYYTPTVNNERAYVKIKVKEFRKINGQQVFLCS